MKAIAYSRSSLRVLRRMPRNDAGRIRTKIAQFAADPDSLANNVKTLKGSPYIRLRIGDWRVIMDERGNVLKIMAIGARGSVYE